MVLAILLAMLLTALLTACKGAAGKMVWRNLQVQKFTGKQSTVRQPINSRETINSRGNDQK